MSDRLEIKITGSNQSSPAFQAVTRDAQQMGQAVEQSATRSRMSFEQFNRAAFAVGAAMGTTAGLLSDFARAAAEEEVTFARLEQAVVSTGKSYDQYSSAIDRAIQKGESLSFSDDQVAESLARLTTVTGDTQASLDQMGLVMDFARARGIDLATSADIIGKVMGGNVGILSRYGITLREGASATEALAMIQARTAGQAEAYADTTQGSLDRIKNRFDNLTETIGAQTGSLQTLLALLPGVTAAYSALGGVVGAMGGFGAIGRFAGPAALVAGGASLAYGYSQNSFGTTATNQFWNEFFKTGATVFNVLTPGSLMSTEKYDEQIQSNQIADVIASLLIAPGESNNVAWDRVAMLTGRTTGEMSQNELTAFVEQAARESGLTVGQYLLGRAQTNPGFVLDPSSGVYMPRQDYLGLVNARAASYVGTPGTDTLARAAGIGIDTSPTAPWFPTRAANPQADLLQFEAERREMLGRLDEAVIDFLSSGRIEPTDLLRAAYPNAPAFEAMRAGGASVDTGANYTRFDVQAQQAIAARDQFATGYGATMGQTQQMGGQSQQLADLTTDLVNEEGVLGKWDDLVSRGVIDLATQQWANFRDVQDDANRIFATNAAIQDDIAVIQLRQLDYNADLQEEYAATIDAISRMSEAEQRRTLAMMDSGEQAKVNEAATLAYRTAMGEIPEEVATDIIVGMAQADPILADLLEQYGIIERGADGEIRVNFPEKENLIEGISELSESINDLVEAIYTVVINGDSSGATTAVSEASTAVSGIDGTNATVTIDADTSPFWGKVNALLGSTVGTAYLALDYLGIASQQRHGGVVGYANGGVIAGMAEAGPELVYARDGGMGVAMTPGLYRVPRGSYVSPAPASRGVLDRAGGSGGIHLHGPVYIYPATGDVEREFTSAIVGEWR